MKKILFVTATGLLCFFTSCKDTSTSSTSSTTDSQMEKNKANSKEVYRAMETGDVSKLDSFIDKDIVDHGDMGDMKGIDTLKKMFVKMHTQYKDFKVDPIANATDGDYNFAYIHFTGTTTDASMGMPANTHMDFNGIDLIKIKDGKAVEHWGFIQGKDMMKMMSNDPTMKPCMDKMMMEMQNKMGGHATDNKMDTTKKM
ncbi:MAG: ester cyclase [Chitinophagaceae bacterium]|nr:ester cyclase [Chitinophagaceae bacterium]